MFVKFRMTNIAGNVLTSKAVREYSGQNFAIQIQIIENFAVLIF